MKYELLYKITPPQRHVPFAELNGSFEHYSLGCSTCFSSAALDEALEGVAMGMDSEMELAIRNDYAPFIDYPVCHDPTGNVWYHWVLIRWSE